MIFKLNNTKTIQFRAKLLIGFIVINLLAIIFLLLFRYSDVLLYISGVVLIFIEIELYNLRCFEIENSGMVFTIKLFHPFKSGHIFSLSEFPVHTLEDFSLTYSLFTSSKIKN